MSRNLLARDDTTAKKSTTSETHGRFRDALAAAAIALLVVAVFWRTFFTGAPVSRICWLSEWDSLFSSYSTGVNGNMDPSLILLMIPYYFLTASIIHSGHLPMWNQFSGLGCPLLADVQSTALSLLHAPLALNPSMQTYNLILVSEIIVMGLGTYAFCRSLGLARLASIFGASTVVFCPYNLWYLELLGNGYCLFPGLFALFALAARKPSYKRAALAGIGCAVLILAGHPELSFCGIAFASLFLLLSAAGNVFGAENKPLPGLRRALTVLGVAAATSFCLAAPVLISFGEFLVNSDTYKFAQGNPSFIPWPMLPLNLIEPGFGPASAYLGVIAFVVLPLAFANAGRRKLSILLAALLVVALAFCNKFGALAFIWHLKPVSYVVPNYAFPIAVLLAAVIAAIGLEGLQSTMKSNRKWHWTLILSMAAIMLCLPLIVRQFKVPMSFANYDMTLPPMAYMARDWQRSLWILLAALPIVAGFGMWKGRVATVSTTLLIALGLASQIGVAGGALPVRPKFDYPQPAIISDLKRQGRRLIAVGDHLLKPNTAVVYGLADLRTENPIYPKRFLRFMQAAGASVDNFGQSFSLPLSPLLDLASIEQVLSQTAVYGAERLPFSTSTCGEAIRISAVLPLQVCSGLTITKMSAFYSSRDAAAFASFTLDLIAQKARHLQYQLVLLNPGGDVLWFDDLHPLLPMMQQHSQAETEALWKQATFSASVPVPISAPCPLGYRLGIQFFDSERHQFIGAARSGKNADHVLVFADFTSHERERPEAERFSLISEGSQHLRIYHNTRALPQAYAVGRVCLAKGEDAALATILSARFHPREEVVLEESEPGAKQAAAIVAHDTTGGGTRAIQARIVSTDGNATAASPDPTVGKARTERAFATNSNGDSALVSSDISSSENACEPAKVVRNDCNEITVQIRLIRPSILVLTDIWYPGWKASLDGKAARIMHANYVFRAVSVPKGPHEIRFSYEPRSFYIGTLLAALATLALIFLFCCKPGRSLLASRLSG